MKSKLVLAALLVSLVGIPAHLFAANCFPNGRGGMYCDDGRSYRPGTGGHLHGSDGSTYRRDYHGHYHGNDGSFVPRGGGAVSGGANPGGNAYGGNAYGGNAYGGNAYGGGADAQAYAAPRGRSYERALARKQQCENGCASAFDACNRKNFCYDMCQARCREDGRRCLSRCK